LTQPARRFEHAPVLWPPPLRPGARVRVVAPSSPFDHALVRRGMAWLGERYRVEFDPRIFGPPGLFAGSDERRLAELNAALCDPALAAVVAARGGYGLTRIVHAIDIAALEAAPKWIVGFSDITALHLEATRAGVVSLNAHNAAGLGRGWTPRREEWRRALEEPLAPRRFGALEAWRSGSAEGPLVGGNLTLLFVAQASGRLALPDGAIVLLEDVGEPSYRVDRMLTALLVSGALDRAAGCVVGSFTDCSPGRHGIEVHDVLRERLLRLGVPVYAGLPVGHGRDNSPLPLGAPARLGDDGLWINPPRRSIAEG
jgi:muramoyltetrapeptide carboxypeptidase